MMMILGEGFNPNPEDFKEAFIRWYNEKIADFDVPEIDEDEVYIVWYCYTLGDAKALVSTTRPDHAYYELTFNKGLDCMHVDHYVKVSHTDISR